MVNFCSNFVLLYVLRKRKYEAIPGTCLFLYEIQIRASGAEANLRNRGGEGSLFLSVSCMTDTAIFIFQRDCIFGPCEVQLPCK
jgi:hypothetical protein